MSFTRFDPTPLRTREQVAREVHAVSLARGLDELATVIALMTISTEVGADDRNGNRQWWCPANRLVPATFGFPHDSESDDNRSSGYFQQQPGPNGEAWWGTPEDMMTLSRAANTFLERLAADYGRAANNPALAGQFAQLVQSSAYPERYAEKWGEAWDVLRRALSETPTTPEVPMPVSGDPVWLEDVLRPALGGRLRTLPGWKTDGIGGTMGQIWGVIWHHTGNAAEKPESISKGRPDLAGPLAQIHIAPDGIVTIVAVGPCNHAGKGSWAGLPTDAANDRTIGIECAWPTIQPDGTYDPGERWPDAQIISMRDVGAALTKHLGVPVSHNISHKEWATHGPLGFRQGKWDPGNLDMDWFRAEIQKDIDGYQFPGETPDVPTPPATKQFPKDYSDRELQEAIAVDVREIRTQLGAGLDEWGEDGDLGRNTQGQRRTVRAGLAALLRKAGAL
ncbi:N-acetylmuramoyl-L-alanine amidase [Mycolicibacterium fortuitum]|uniref:N-acetylmuramoyl-L-alanine amidase n=1 Tax=Mycolicibacterium fortuitum TaxID=1766 RepID=A0AAE4VH65_MYCFO|nr:N-acetylmuramoyl-L-alanine amidase [Mycolicibacterium fortuitum]MDV7195753.1 N-acetylmuramoyl-L-alanine amidase [Mycolicibacterium fortuitum]MDV7207725.1 N-acetylmuramoyl-L-alanine amidase [Mycolicibacterium fortuitum]MDV7229781.1 N-acetylmuramoyl-L-alanine amidase [Mycolicibacterium fortuitum]MDV7261466.1 N-acetylmuramoyl-L-alanine amidase [Mycolicibacterium fortuitum]MDV7286754.1 N-acetylmuramoyl-L-alanine amidase [Mycolicibacterium fortuitum]